MAGVSRRKGPRTTCRAPKVRPAPDLVERRFEAEAPDRLWVADITYVPTAAGFLYLAVVLDVFSRRVVGWAMADHLRTEGKFRSLRELALKFRSLRELAWCSMRWTWRWDNDARPRSSITLTRVASTPHSPSVNAAANGA